MTMLERGIEEKIAVLEHWFYEHTGKYFEKDYPLTFKKFSKQPQTLRQSGLRVPYGCMK